MPKILTCLLPIILLISACNSQSSSQEALDNHKIYLFYHNECPYCIQDMDYINQNYPDLEVTMVNIYNNGGMKLLQQCAAKFNLGEQIGTPLFCFGDKYIMGWSQENISLFNQYATDFINAKP